jgi:SAM-dependent methyltransferase
METPKFENKISPENIEKINKIKSVFNDTERISYGQELELRSYFGMQGEREKIEDSKKVEQNNNGEKLYSNISYDMFCLDFEHIRHIGQKLNLQKEDTFYDLGSGYGQVPNFLAINSEAQFKGVELMRDRLAQAKLTARKFDLKNVSFIEGNVTDIDFSDGNTFYLFNPFSSETLENVAGKLQEIAKTKKIKIISAGNCTHYFADKCRDWLRPVEDIDRLGLIFESK